MKTDEVCVQVTREFVMKVDAPNKHTAMSAVEDLCEEQNRHVDDEIETILHDENGDWVRDEHVVCKIEDSVESLGQSSWASEMTGGKPISAWEKN